MNALMPGKRIQSDKKTAPQSFYLGKQEEKETRLAALHTIAAQFGLSGISELMQRIADGDLIVALPPQRPKKFP